MDLIRADILIVQQGKAESRSQAADLIRRGVVTYNGRPVSKAGTLIPKSANVVIREEGNRFVSRGGHKLSGALDEFQIDPGGFVVMDVGASTGGFTDCLIRRGAEKVYAIDTGYGQLHWKLRNHPRVVVLERLNIRYIDPEVISDPIDMITMDVSFISVQLIIPVIVSFLKPGGILLPMIKPQFEAGKEFVGSGGVIRNRSVHQMVLEEFAAFASGNGWSVRGIVNSKLLGPKGNREFFFFLKKGRRTEDAEIRSWIQNALDSLKVMKKV